jgi:hypothetical protein
MENKQTAVEWLYDKLVTGKFTGKDTIDFLYETAKQMEKEQIIDAFGIGCQVESTRLIGYQDLAEQYYNENFGVQ